MGNKAYIEARSEILDAAKKYFPVEWFTTSMLTRKMDIDFSRSRIGWSLKQLCDNKYGVIEKRKNMKAGVYEYRLIGGSESK